MDWSYCGLRYTLTIVTKLIIKLLKLKNAEEK